MASEKETVKAEVKADELKEDGKKATKKSSKNKTAYFMNRKMAALRIVWQRPKDRLNPNPDDRKVERFVAYYDTWKGDRVKVGYLKTDNPKVIEICQNDNSCEEITQKEYEKAVDELDVAPVKVA